MSDNPNRLMSLLISPCSLKDGVNCKDLQTLAKSLLQFVRLDAALDTALYLENNIRHIVDQANIPSSNVDLLIHINPALNTKIRQNFINNEIIDKTGFFFPDK